MATKSSSRAIRVSTRKARGTRLLKPLSLKVAKRAKHVRATVWVAVIVRQGFKAPTDVFAYTARFDSNRHDDGWFALIGDDKQALVVEALAKARSFGSTYEVAVGRLDEMVVVPTFFEYQTL